MQRNGDEPVTIGLMGRLPGMSSGFPVLVIAILAGKANWSAVVFAHSGQPGPFRLRIPNRPSRHVLHLRRAYISSS